MDAGGFSAHDALAGFRRGRLFAFHDSGGRGRRNWKSSQLIAERGPAPKVVSDRKCAASENRGDTYDEQELQRYRHGEILSPSRRVSESYDLPVSLIGLLACALLPQRLVLGYILANPAGAFGSQEGQTHDSTTARSALRRSSLSAARAIAGTSGHLGRADRHGGVSGGMDPGMAGGPRRQQLSMGHRDRPRSKDARGDSPGDPAELPIRRHWPAHLNPHRSCDLLWELLHALQVRL